MGHHTLIYDEPTIARTGVTVIVPREGAIWTDNVFAAFHSFNGNDEMTGSHSLAEFGFLAEPIAITNTHQVGVVRDALIAYMIENDLGGNWSLPTVAETYDGYLNDINAFHLGNGHVYKTLETTTDGPVEEGNVGGGTGMICHEFKGGIGPASRWVDSKSGRYTVGVWFKPIMESGPNFESMACRLAVN